MLDLGSLDLEEIANALAGQTGYEHRWLINPETGEVVFWTADTGIDGRTPVDLDELDLICINPLPSWVWYQGKGAFRRFKDELHEEYPDLVPAWYAFRDARAGRRAVRWLADNSLIDGSSCLVIGGQVSCGTIELGTRSASALPEQHEARSGQHPLLPSGQPAAGLPSR